MIALTLILTRSSAHATPSETKAPPAPAPGRTETALTSGWRFAKGDLPFNGGPLLCADQLEEVAFPISLTGKACALGARENWSRITSGDGTTLPADCSRACCSNPKCSLWSWCVASLWWWCCWCWWCWG